VNGGESHVSAVNSYIRNAIDGWSYYGSPLNSYISSSDTVGCSIRPACRNQAVIACLFSGSSGGNPNEEIGEQKALAFTPKQYEKTEKVTHRNWDGSHFLENLSGFETECSMLTTDTWSFPYASLIAKQEGIRITGLFGKSRNLGETEPAMLKIVKSMKKVQAKQVGCSIIPDCEDENGQMWVVVGCIFEENSRF